MSPKANCWEDRNCGREPGGWCVEHAGPCRAAVDATWDGLNGGTNGGRICWAVAGTFCDEAAHGHPEERSKACGACPFFRRVKYEEGCHFQFLKPGLGTTQPEGLHRRLNDVVNLVTLYRDILACLDVKQLLRRVVELAFAVTDASGTGVYLGPGSGGGMALEAQAGWAQLPERVGMADDSPASRAVRDRRLWQGPWQADGAGRSACAMATPVAASPQSAGALVCVCRGDGFSPDDQWFLTELGLVANLGIRNAEVLESLRRLRGKEKERVRQTAVLLHEIRSPLATIACALTAMTDVEVALSPEDREELLRCCLQRVDSIRGLSDCLLDLASVRSRDAAGGRPVCPSEVLTEEVRKRQTEAARHGLEIVFASAPACPPVRGSRDGLRLIFGNLLDNAIKYSRGKGRRVEVSLAVCDGRVCVGIRDEGIGIPPEERGRLFEPFHRAGNAAASATPGFGLGLSIVKELVTRFGGDVWVDSTVGEGTAVRVELAAAGAPMAVGDANRKEDAHE